MSKMGKQKPEKSMHTKSDRMLSFKAPINRIAANSITKNIPLKKELFNIALPVAAARMQPNLIGPFVKQHAKK
jgi:hypothetical protein